MAELAKKDFCVVVPTRNSARTLESCLRSIRSQSQPCTLMVVDNYSLDETPRIAAEFADLVISKGPERSAQRNAGVAATESPFVGFIDSDMELTDGVLGEVSKALLSGAASVVVPECTVGTGYWAAVRAYERQLYQGVGAIDAPRFFPRSVFLAAGKWDENMTGAEDSDLAVRTQDAGPRISTTAGIIHDEGCVRYFAACRRKAHYALGIKRFIQKYGFSGFSAPGQRPWVKKPWLLMNPLGVGLVVLKIGELVAVTWVVLLAEGGRRVHLDLSRSGRSGKR